MIKLIKKYGLAVFALLVSAGGALADPPIVPGDVTDVISDSTDFVIAVVVAALPFVGYAVLGALALWAIPKAVGWIRRALGR